MSAGPPPPPPPCLPPTSLLMAPSCPPPPPPASANGPSLSPPLASKISPAGLRGLSNSTTVPCTPLAAVCQAVDRCIKFQPSLSEQVFLCHNHHTQPRLQEGPQCGMVALAIAGGEGVQVDQVQELAIRMGYTKQGEMFNVDDMAYLASTVLGTEALISATAALSDNEWVVEQLTGGWLLLVPYDCAHNHHPAMEGGRKAHWALITGFALAMDASEDISDIETETKNSLVHLVTGIPQKEKISRLITGNNVKLLLLARQSKSLVLGLWDKEELVSSNNNLRMIDCKRELSEFMIPAGGVEAGLCGRMVLVRSGES
eukprot:GFUD01012196.1.p1 GENE.GFUD01012196.1~~GFUD01012196.1.p1  ORF type:complete len:315 (+),score=124.40 GFUD01012196.1:80-1024(+)